jgi:hypothetical protein
MSGDVSAKKTAEAPRMETVLPLVVRRDGSTPPAATSSVRSRQGTLASIELSGLFATSPDALRRRLLGPWSEGLRQYLAIRLGDVSTADDALRELRRLVTATPTSELVLDPGPKARVYRLARRIARDRLERPIAVREPLVFRVPGDVDRGYLVALDVLRTQLDDEARELLELRHARELLPVELACVLDRSEAEVERALEAAQRAATKRLGATPFSPSLVVDAYALAGTPVAERRDETGAEREGVAEGTLVGGRYRVVSRVGVGAFGDVYRADDQDVPGHRVALKVLREPALSQAARDEALRELKLIAAVFHPSVVLFKDHGWFEDRLWFVMPWYEGETLEARMRRVTDGRLGITRAQARRIFEPLARALSTLHGSGVRHQDIKPDNVFLARIKGLSAASDEAGILPVLIDLGVAAKDHEALIGGTPVYFAPEVAAHYAQVGTDVIGPKADVFALALSLRNALEPETEEDVPAGAVEAFIQRRAREAPPLPTRRELSFLRPYFARWLAVDPDDRPSAEEFARELEVLTRPEERRARTRKTLAWLVPMLASVAAIFSMVVYLYSRESELQRQEIDQARVEVANVRADLLVEEARRQALDQDHAQLMQQYEEGRLSRSELAGQLATAQGQIEILGSRIASLIAERDQIATDIAAVRARLTQSEATLTSTAGQLREERDERRATETELADARAEHERAQAELDDELAAAEVRNDALNSELSRTRDELDRTEARMHALEARVEVAEDERDDARRDYDELERRVSELREMLDRLRPASRDEVAGAP